MCAKAPARIVLKVASSIEQLVNGDVALQEMVYFERERMFYVS